MIGCHGEPSTAPPPAAPASAAAPVEAAFVDLASAAPVATSPCESVYVAVARGHASVSGEALAEGDVLYVENAPSMTLGGAGLALVARVRHAACATPPPATQLTIVRAAATPDLTWNAGGGVMHAHLDVESPAANDAYFGRLSGTSPVAPHAHAASWEILAAVDASGTFVLDGKPGRLGPRQIVVVPPGVTHQWTPDPGSALVALQMYAPPGPEQRFRALADAGAK